jgi:DNA-binding PadR family transcriptional regulator
MSTEMREEEKANELVDRWIQRYRRGSLRFFILHLLLYRHKNPKHEKPHERSFHGYQLKKVIHKLTNRKWEPTTASIYPILQELSEEKIIKQIETSDEADQESRPIKQYCLTPFGINVAEKLESARKDFAKAFIIKHDGAPPHPPPPFRELSKEEIIETLRDASLDRLEELRHQMTHALQYNQEMLKAVEKELETKKNK